MKLTSVASQAYSKSARAMLEALMSGVTDPDVLAEPAKARMRSKIPQLREALQNRFQVSHHGVLVAQLLAHIDTLDAAIQTLDEEIEAMLAGERHLIELLCTIPGVAVRIAQVLIAECGLDMARFPSVAHFASWAGMCPGHHESAGRRRSGRTRPGPRWLTEALTEAAKAASRTKGTCLAAHHGQLRGRRGEAKAIGATRHDILVAYHHIVRDQVPFRELGPDWQRKRYSPEHRARRADSHLSGGLLRQGERAEPVAAFRFIAAERAHHSVKVMCRVLGVSRAGFYAWERRAPSDRDLADVWLTEKIRAIHTESKGTYGVGSVQYPLFWV